MAILTIGTALTGIAGAVAWFGTLPNEFKYLIFLGGLTADAGVTTMIGLGNGVIGTFVTLLFSQGFQITGFIVTSWQLLVLFTILPLTLFLLKNSLAHQ